MPITLLKGDGKQLTNVTESLNLAKSSGFWNSIEPGDFDNDGDIDFVAGNLGLNSNLKVVDNHPIRLDYADFDDNGSVDPIFSKFELGQYYPLATLDQLIKQLPKIKKNFLYYKDFAKSSTEDILKTFDIDGYKTLEVHELRSVYIENLGNGKFKLRSLPLESQIAPINGILAEDFDHDGYLDLLMVGNNYATEVGAGRYDASVGVMLKNKGDGTFKVINNNDSGFLVIGDSKSIVKVHTAKKSLVLVGKNNSTVTSNQIILKGETFVQPYLNEAYAEITFNNGPKRRHEFTWGGGHLSQSSNKIKVINAIESITIFNYSQEVTRKLDFN